MPRSPTPHGGPFRMDATISNRQPSREKMRAMIMRFASLTLLVLAGAASVQNPSTPTAPLHLQFIGGSIGTRVQSPASTAAASTPSFDAVLAEVEAAQVQLVNGRPDAFKALWSHSDDVTLSGGLGGAIAKGWTQVNERLDWVATQYVDGARTHQEVARYVGEDLAYVVLRETIRFKSPADRTSMIQELRVTQVFRREGGRWRIVHRHADSQIAKTNNG